MPAPSRLTSATPSIPRDPLDQPHRGRDVDAEIFVPGCEALNVLRMRIGMPAPTAGAIVCGWITFAPKYASSIASLYDISSMIFASGTRRGSPLMTPSTSVQMCTSLASSNAPKIEAE